MNLKGINYLISYFGLIVIFLGSCQSNVFKKEIQVVIKPYQFWNPADPENSDKYINPDKYEITKHFCFTVNGINGSDADTFIFSEKKLEGKEIKIVCRTTLTLPKPISIEQIEELLSLTGIENHNLRYKLYWLDRLRFAKIVNNKDQYGDVTGSYAVSGDEYIPSEFYCLSNDNLNIIPKVIELGSQSYGNNEIMYSLKVNSTSIYDSKIELHSIDSEFKDSIDDFIYLSIRIVSYINLNIDGILISNYSEIFPFNYTYEEL